MTAMLPRLMCPRCHAALLPDCSCPDCTRRYELFHGVYNVVHPDVSQGQTVLWQISDEELSSDHVPQEPAWTADYQARKNKETLEAEEALKRRALALLRTLRGAVCDLATGRGGMLQMMLDACGEEVTSITCTDLSPRILALTRRLKRTDDQRVFYVATDGCALSFCDESFDAITSFAGFGNIPNSPRVAAELYRVLRHGGRLIVTGNYLEEGSRSAALARQVGVEEGMLEALLLRALKDAGFEHVTSEVVGEAVWAENPYDLLPVAGDRQRFCVLQAWKQ